jgi:hypothetical protein
MVMPVMRRMVGIQMLAVMMGARAAPMPNSPRVVLRRGRDVAAPAVMTGMRRRVVMPQIMQEGGLARLARARSRGEESD